MTDHDVAGQTDAMFADLDHRRAVVTGAARGTVWRSPDACSWVRTTANPEAARQHVRAERMRRSIPMREPGCPDDVAKAALLLLSDWTGYVTGQNLRVDGGLSLSNWTIEPDF